MTAMNRLAALNLPAAVACPHCGVQMGVASSKKQKNITCGSCGGQVKARYLRGPLDQIKITRGSSWNIGGSLFIIVIFMVFFAFMWMSLPSSSSTSIIIIAGELLLAFSGVVLVTYREGIILDRRNGTVTTWRGLLIPIKKMVYNLAEIDSVLIKSYFRLEDGGYA